MSDQGFPGIRMAHHTGFTVSSLERSLRFWNDVMGFPTLVVDRIEGNFISRVIGVPNSKVSLAMVQAPGHIVELLAYDGPQDRQTYAPRCCDVGSVHLAFLVDDINDILKRVTKAGWTQFDEPQHIDRGPKEGTLVMYVQDPDGITIEFMQLLGAIEGL